MKHINKLLTLYSPNKWIFDTNDYSWSHILKNNWKTILNEYNEYKLSIPQHKKINSQVSQIDINDKWKVLYLRAFNCNTEKSKYFPKTMNFINNIPDCTLAFFSVLEPNAYLEPHVGIYKGVLRYHLALKVPEDNENCYIVVNNNKMHWNEGHDIMFDDMYEHYVVNNTNETRIILFLDIKRKFDNVFINFLNTCFLHFVKSNDILKTTIDNVNNN
jgi:aspartyl/asparaginyl beta-hydroxylase (cupin superfamily)